MSSPIYGPEYVPQVVPDSTVGGASSIFLEIVTRVPDKETLSAEMKEAYSKAARSNELKGYILMTLGIIVLGIAGLGELAAFSLLAAGVGTIFAYGAGLPFLIASPVVGVASAAVCLIGLFLMACGTAYVANAKELRKDGGLPDPEAIERRNEAEKYLP